MNMKASAVAAVAVVLSPACSAQAETIEPSDLDHETACGDAEFALMSESEAVTITIDGALDRAIELDQHEFEYSRLATNPAVTVAYVRDEFVQEFFCDDTDSNQAGHDGEFDEVWPVADGTLSLEIEEFGEEDPCGFRPTMATVTLRDATFRGSDGASVTLDEVSSRGQIGWSPPGC